MLPCAQKRSFFDYVLNYLTTLHELLHDVEMKLSVELKNLQESLSFKRFPNNNNSSYDPYLTYANR